MPKTTKFSVLVDRAREKNPNWGANVGEYRRAAEDAMALGKLRESRDRQPNLKTLCQYCARP